MSDVPPSDFEAERELVGRASLPAMREFFIAPAVSITDLVYPHHRTVYADLLRGFRFNEQDYDYFAGSTAIPTDELIRRVKTCSEARRLIDVAQEMATRAWRLDIEGARRAARFARAPAVGVDEATL